MILYMIYKFKNLGEVMVPVGPSSPFASASKLSYLR